MRKRILNTIKTAFSNQEQDYTQGSISKALVLLAIPMILELSLESVFAVVDMFFVSELGSNAIATVGLTEAVITLIYAAAIGLSTAATAVVSRRIGEKEPVLAAKAGAQAITMGLVTAIVLSILGIVFASDILTLMGAHPKLVEEGTTFTQVMLGGSAAILFLFLINGVFRGAGNAAMAMKSLWIASGVNIILCPIFIHFFGLKGAAIATVLGRSSGVLYQCYHLFYGTGILKMKRAYFIWDMTYIKNLFQIAWPATLQFVLASGSWTVMARLVADTGGAEASAGYQVAIRNIVFFILPAWGLSNAAATLVGQNLGANQPKRAEDSVWLATKYNAIFMGFVSLIFLFLSGPIIRVFTQDAVVVNYGVQALRIIGAGFVFYGISMVMTQALNGAGDTKTPTYINAVCFWLFQVPLAYFLSKVMEFGPVGAFIAVPAAEIAVAVLAFYYFRKGAWKKAKA